MALQLGLADFQLVHPTETETFTTLLNTGEVDEHLKPKIVPVTKERRKRLPIKGAKVVIRGIRVLGRKEPAELTFEVDATGRAICAVTGDYLPQAPMECDFEFYGPDSLISRGKVRCGGNEQVNITEVAAQAA